MSFDLITLGRVSIDLFSENIGAPFEQIESFETSVGGSPTNIAIGSSRLGLKVASITAVGEDKTGDFVINYLQNEKVSTDFIPRKANTRTGMAVVGVQPPAQFPLVFYRDNASDIYLTIDDVENAPIAESRALLLSGTALSRGTCRDATLYAANTAHEASTIVFMDLDLRPDQWTHPRAYGLNVRAVFSSLDVLIGTEEEFFAALSSKPEPIMQGQSVNDKQELEVLLQGLLTTYPTLTLVVKRGADGVSILRHEQPDQNVAGFPVEVLNTVGAGDAFASGLIYGRLQDWDWYKSARLANACGALVVTRNGCARALPYQEEIQSFIDNNGGF
jgi:5-dehydro-2-deoxygluconokinase